MFKWLWLIFLVIIWFTWGVFAVKNVIETFKEVYYSKRGKSDIFEFLDELEDYSSLFFIVTFLILLGWSLILFLIDFCGGAK